MNYNSLLRKYAECNSFRVNNDSFYAPLSFFSYCKHQSLLTISQYNSPRLERPFRSMLTLKLVMIDKMCDPKMFYEGKVMRLKVNDCD